MIKKTSNRVLLVLDYESLVAALATVYLLETLHLVTLYPILKTVLNIVQFGLLGCIGLLFAKQSVSKGNMLVRLMTIAVFMASSFASGTFPYLKFGLVLLAGVSANMPKLYKKLLKTYGVGVTLVLLLGMAGILPSTIVRRGFSTYGFEHSNVIASYFLAILCCYILSRKKQLRLKDYLIMMAVMAASWWLTDSRTSALSMLLLLVLCVTGKWGNFLFSRKSVLRYLAILTPVLLLTFSLFLGRYYHEDTPLLSAIDIVMNGRLNLANQVIDLLSVPLFGQKVEMTLVENAYVSGLYHFGLIPMLVELGIYMYAIRKSIRSRDYARLACLLTFAVHGLAESSTFGPFQNVALFSVFCRTTMKESKKQGSRTR